MKNLILFILTMLTMLGLSVKSQTGPGGVGNSDGSDGQPKNILWLDAETLGLSDEATVNGWTDVSGNTHNMPSGSANPSYKTGIINSRAVVRFDKSNSEYLDFYNEFNTDDGVLGSTYTFFWVAARRNTDNNQYVFGGGGTSPNRNLYSGWGYSGGQSLGVNHWSSNCYATTGNYYTDDANEFGFISAVFNSTNRTVKRELFDNGTSIATLSRSSSLKALTTPRLAWRVNEGFADVDIAEIIFYNTNLNVAQKVIVENYLSEKYAIAFQSSSNDKFTNHDASYVYDIVGIGQEADGDHTQTVTGGLYLYEWNSSLANGEYVMMGHNNATNSSATATVNDLPTGTEKRWARDWYLKKTSSDGTDIKLIFDFDEALTDGTFPDSVENYVLLYRVGTSGDYSKITVAEQGLGDADQVFFNIADANLIDGYYTIGTDDQTNSPITGGTGRTWYSLASGNWDTSDYWTLDPSGSLPNNLDNEIPTSIDKVVITTGKTITLSSNSKSLEAITIDGVLQLETSSGHDFTEINGTGRIRLKGDNFPVGDATHFVTAEQGEGTVVWQGGTYSISAANTFYNMEVELDNSSNIITLLDDLTINGSLIIENGILQINDNSITDVININVTKDVSIESTGQINVGTGDTYSSHSQYHQFIISEDFTNEGVAIFTNRSSADYSNDDDDGAVEVIFDNSSINQAVQCNGTTVFNQLTCNKGADATYILEVTASSTANFKLYGRNDEEPTGASGSIDGNKALRLLAGTLKLGSNIVIPELSDYYDYSIDSDAKLWLAGNADVSISTSGSYWLYVYGELRVSDNSTLTETTGEGVIIREQGTVRIEGGTSELECLTTSATGEPGSQVGAYIQSDGTVYINDERNSDFAPFHLPFNENIFNMSGGTLHIKDQGNGGAGDNFAFIVNSEEGNYSVTGGTVIVDMIYNDDFKIVSRAPIWNLIIRDSEASTNNSFIIDEYTGSTDCEDITPALPLVILNDLTIEAAYTPTFDANNTDVYIGGDFSIEEGTTYDYGTNTTTFDGTDDGILYIGWSIDDGYEQYFNNFTVNKPIEKQLLIQGDTEKEPPNSSEYNNRLVNTLGTLSIISGTLNQGKQSIRINGSVFVGKDGKLGIYEAGTTETTAYIMLKDDDVVLDTENGAEFGNIKLNSSSHTVSLSSNVYAKRIVYYNGLLNLGSYNLKLDYLHNSSSTTNYPITAGGTGEMMYCDANASDGGLSILITENSTYGFPLGTKTTATRYTPAELTVTNFSDSGYVTIRPVDGELKTTDLSGGDLLSYYWRVGYDDFTTNPTVQYEFTYDDSDIVGTESDYYPGKVLDENPYTRSYEDDYDNVVDGSNTIIFDNVGSSGFTLEKANYTAGVANRFAGSPSVFYSNSWYGTWSNGAIWHQETKAGTTGTVPTEGSIAIIYRDDADEGRIWGHTISVEPAEIKFEHNYTVYPTPTGENMPRLQFDAAGTYPVGRVIGTGMLSFNANYAITLSGDIGDFGNNNESYILYFGAGDNTITDIPTPIPNLYLENGTKRIGEDITVNNDFILNGWCTVYLENDLDIERDMVVGMWEAGDIRFPATGSSVTVTVGRNIDFSQENNSNDRDLIVTDGGDGTLEHKLILKGDIIHSDQNDNTIDFYNGEAKTKVILEIQGDSCNSYYRSSTSVPDFYRIVLNKGNNQDSSFTFSDDFTLSGATSGSDVYKALELQNGKLILDDVDIDIDLTTGDDDFEIPTTACLEIKQGTVNVSGDDTGISLSGKLLISGGEVDMDDASNNGNNYIEYSASGDATIEVTGGTLTVGSQIRRGLKTTEGVLNYTQSGGTVVIGKNAAPDGSRGVLEILNTGSSFTHSAGSLTLVRQQTNQTTASLYLDPATSSLSDGTSITLGNASTPASQEFGIYSTINLQNLTLASTNSPVTKMLTGALSLNGELTIESGAELNANGLNLNLHGNFTNNGTFTTNLNSTYIKGSSNQEIDGNTTFYNLTNQNSAEVNLSSGNTNLNITNILTLESGTTLNDNSNNIFVYGDISNEGTHVYGGSGDGITLIGTSEQTMTGSGTFGKLTINNANGVTVTTGNSPVITNFLKLESGVFDINSNLLTLNAYCTIIEANPFSATNMIQTNASFTDNGVKKYYPAGTGNFTYPIGSGGKYTPVITYVTQNTNTLGSLTVKAADEIHPSIIEDTEGTDPDIVDADNVLQYYWNFIADGFTEGDGIGTVEFYYDVSDVEVTSPYDVYDYIVAKLLDGEDGNWNKYDDVDKFDEQSNKLVFDFYNVTDDDLTGEFTAGVDGSWFYGAIPDNVPLYVSKKTGCWCDDVWTHDEGIPHIPKGARVQIREGDTITIAQNYVSGYTTEINGVLNMGESFGNRIGKTTGSGKLYTESSSLPAGYFESFFAESNGTLEYGGSNDYSTLSEITTVNNLTFSGTGTREFANLTVDIVGDLTINGSDVVNEHSIDINVNGNTQFESGTYDAKLGKNVFNGSSLQTIDGTSTFTGSSAFYNFEIDNENGLTISKDVDVSNTLILTNGLINPGANTLKITNTSSDASSGASSASYVNGKLSKEALAGGSFVFPIGNATHFKKIALATAGADGTTWTAEYLGLNSDSDIKTGDELIEISEPDRWSLGCSISTTAKVGLYWDSHSNLDESAALADLRVAKINNSEWHSTGNSGTSGNYTSGYVTSVDTVHFSYQEFSIGGVSAVLPVELLFFTGKSNINNIELFWATATETNNDYFEIERSDDAENYYVIGLEYGAGNSMTQLDYNYIDENPYHVVNYYRLKQVDYNGDFEYHKPISVNYGDDYTNLSSDDINVYPNPYYSGQLILDLSKLEAYTSIKLSVVGINGKTIYIARDEVPADKIIYIIPVVVDNLKEGIYFVSVQTVNNVFTKKVIVK